MNDAGDGEAFGVLRPGVAFRSSPETSVFGNGLRRTQSGVEPPHSKALALHFVILSGLRYTQHEFLEFLGSANMIPITYELAKQSSTFSAMVKDVKQEARGQGRSEGLAEGRAEAFAELLRKLAVQRFPDLTIGAELDRIRNAEALEQLCLQVSTIKSSKALLQQISQLVETSKQPKAKKNGTSKK